MHSSIDFKTMDPTNSYEQAELGYLALPGTYNISMSKFEDGKLTELVTAQPFVIKPLNNTTLPATDKKMVEDFSSKVSELRRVAGGADNYRSELVNKIKYIK